MLLVRFGALRLCYKPKFTQGYILIYCIGIEHIWFRIKVLVNRGMNMKKRKSGSSKDKPSLLGVHINDAFEQSRDFSKYAHCMESIPKFKIHSNIRSACPIVVRARRGFSVSSRCFIKLLPIYPAWSHLPQPHLVPTHKASKTEIHDTSLTSFLYCPNIVAVYIQSIFKYLP